MATGAAVLREHGIWPMISGHRFHIAPPLITTEKEMAQLLDAIDAAAAAISAELFVLAH